MNGLSRLQTGVFVNGGMSQSVGIQPGPGGRRNREDPSFRGTRSEALALTSDNDV